MPVPASIFTWTITVFDSLRGIVKNKGMSHVRLGVLSISAGSHLH